MENVQTNEKTQFKLMINSVFDILSTKPSFFPGGQSTLLEIQIFNVLKSLGCNVEVITVYQTWTKQTKNITIIYKNLCT